MAKDPDADFQEVDSAIGIMLVVRGTSPLVPGPFSVDWICRITEGVSGGRWAGRPPGQVHQLSSTPTEGAH